jgi:hypothetical protein
VVYYEPYRLLVDVIGLSTYIMPQVGGCDFRLNISATLSMKGIETSARANVARVILGEYQ